MARQSVEVTFGNRPVQIMDAKKYSLAAGKANSYFCPLGPDIGRGWLVMLRKDVLPLVGIQGNRSAGHRVWGSAPQHTLRIACTGDGSGARTIEITGLGIVEAQCITYGSPRAPDAAYLVEVADATQKQFRWSTINEAFNVRLPVPRPSDGDAYAVDRFYARTIRGETLFTWQQMLNRLWFYADTGFPALPYEPVGFPESWIFRGANRWRAINTVLKHLWCAIGRNPLGAHARISQNFVGSESVNTGQQGGLYRLFRLGGVQPGLSAAIARADILYDSEPLYEPRFNSPAVVRSYFHSTLRHFGRNHDVLSEASGTKNIVNYRANARAAGGWRNDTPDDRIFDVRGNLPWTELHVWNDAAFLADSLGGSEDIDAVRESSNDPHNAHLAARALEYERNFYAAHDQRPRHVILQGIVDDVLPGNEVKAVLWRNFGPDPDDALWRAHPERAPDGWVTEFWTYPGFPRPFVEPLGMFRGMHPSPVRVYTGEENLEPPNYARRTWPSVYPHETQIVSINASDPNNAQVEFYTTPQTTSPALFSGQIIKYTAGQGQSFENCWVRHLGAGDGGEGLNELKIDSKWIGRVVGWHREGSGDEADGRPLIAIVGSIGAQVDPMVCVDINESTTIRVREIDLNHPSCDAGS